MSVQRTSATSSAPIPQPQVAQAQVGRAARQVDTTSTISQSNDPSDNCCVKFVQYISFPLRKLIAWLKYMVEYYIFDRDIPEHVRDDLRNWINEADGTPEHATREAIANLIKYCIAHESRDIDLSGNLTSLPESIGEMTHLVRLNLSRNQLESLPESIGNLNHLRYLNLSHNRLQRLPEALFNLSNRLVINASHNPSLVPRVGNGTGPRIIYNHALSGLALDNLAVLMVDPRFEGVIRAANREPARVRPDPHPRAEPRATLNEVLTDLLREFETAFPQRDHPEMWAGRNAARFPSNRAFLNAYKEILDHKEQNTFRNFFNKLRTSGDYVDNHKSFLLRFDQFLHDILTNEEFRDGVTPIMDAFLDSCEDGAALAFNQIDMYWQDVVNPAVRTSRGFAERIIGQKKMELLENIAKRDIRNFGTDDHVQVYLFYQTRLRETLNLPTRMQGMLFGCVIPIEERDDYVNRARDSIINQTSSLEHKANLLMASPIWRKKVEEEYSKERVERILDGFGPRKHVLEDQRENMDPEEYRLASEALQSEQDEEVLHHILYFTREFVTKEFAPGNRRGRV